MGKSNVENKAGATRIVGGVMLGAGDWREGGEVDPVADPNAELNALMAGTLTKPSSDEGSLFAKFLKYFNLVGGVGSKTNSVTGRIEVSSGEASVFSKSKSVKTAIVDYANVSIGAPTSGWTCIKSTEKIVDGLQTLKVTAIAGAADDGVIVLTFPAKFFGAAKRLGFGICSSDIYISGNPSQVVQMFINTSAGGHRIQCASNDSHVSGDFDFRWSYVGVDLENVVSLQSKWPNLALDNVTSISLVVKKRAGMELAPIYISPVIADPVGGVSPSVLTLFFDGGYVSQYNASKMLKSRGLTASFATVVPRIGSSGAYMTLDQVRELYSDGHEMICHTGTAGEVGWDDAGKYPDGSEYALVKADIQAFQSWAAVNGFSSGLNYGVVGFTNGLISSQTLTRRDNISRAIVDAGVIKVRQLGGWTGPYYGDSFSPSYTTPSTTMLDASLSVSTITGIIDTLIARPGGWHGLTMHSLLATGATGNAINADTLRQVLDYIDAKVSVGQLRVMNFSQAMSQYRQI